MCCLFKNKKKYKLIVGDGSVTLHFREQIVQPSSKSIRSPWGDYTMGKETYNYGHSSIACSLSLVDGVQRVRAEDVYVVIVHHGKAFTTKEVSQSIEDMLEGMGYCKIKERA